VKQLIIYGNGVIASLCHYYLTRESDYTIAAFTVDASYISSPVFHGVPVVPWDEAPHLYPPDKFRIFIAVGFVQSNRLRESRYFEAKALGYHVISHTSPKALLWDGFKMGENCFFGPGVDIQPYVEIGQNVHVGNNTIIGHNSTIGDHCFISAGALLAGNVTVANHCYIGIGATVRDNISIASNCTIGAGAIILSDTQEHGIYMSKPAYKLPQS